MHYRIYILQSDKSILAADNFVAANDSEAIEVGYVISGACADVCGGYELWSQCRLVVQAKVQPSVSWRYTAIVSQRRTQIIDLAKRLQAGFVCLARSKLLSEIAAYRLEN